MRKAFKFYRSYYEVGKELPEKDRLLFLWAVLEKQFEGKEPALKGMAKFAYISQKHSIDLQVVGYEDKTGLKLTPTLAPTLPPSVPPSVQEKEKEKEKEKYRKFKHLSISFEENDKLIKLGYSQKQIDDIYNRIENHKKNTNYSSLYLTSINWLKVQYPNVVKFDTKNKYTEAQIRQAKNYWSMDRILPDFFDKNDLHLLQ